MRVVFSADGGKSWILHDKNVLECEKLFLKPWHESMITSWLDDLGIHTDAEERSKIVDVTGAWPSMLLHLERLREKAPNQSIKEIIGSFQSYVDCIKEERGFLTHFEIHNDILPIFNTFAELSEEKIDWEGAAPADLASLIEEYPEEYVYKVLDWAESMYYVGQCPSGCLRLDNVLLRFLKASDE